MAATRGPRFDFDVGVPEPVDGLETGFAPWLKRIASAAGLHLAALARPGVDAGAIVERARHAEVRIASIRSYGGGRSGPRGLLFGYGAIEAQAIGEGLARLRRVMTR